ncbi:MAG: CmcI family methyltransferase [Pirellulaceae bacterium]
MTSKGSSVQDDSHSDYHKIKQQAKDSMHRGVWQNRFEERFVPLSQREMKCDLPKEAIRAISQGKHYISYRGIPMAKDPFDIVLYETLFYELQPKAIIELGAYTGASALWMADILKTFDCPAEIISVDIDLSLVDEQAQAAEHVRFIEGDCHQIEELFPAKMLQELPHPFILIDDAHVNIDGVYGHFHQHALRSGDYFIVEDTVPWIPGKFGEADDQTEWGDWKWGEISEFFKNHEADYRVDQYYTDFFGYNTTWNWNGFLRRQ